MNNAYVYVVVQDIPARLSPTGVAYPPGYHLDAEDAAVLLGNGVLSRYVMRVPADSPTAKAGLEAHPEVRKAAADASAARAAAQSDPIPADPPKAPEAPSVAAAAAAFSGKTVSVSAGETDPAASDKSA